MVATARAPRAVEIRAYQVGFGACLLVSFVYDADDKRHVLIDFGSVELPRRGRPPTPTKPSEYMPRVAESIRAVSGGRLTAVVATHRHADHISGFGTDARTGKSGEIIRSLRPKVVLQPWTEDPDAATNARTATRDSSRSRRRFTAGLAAMHDIAGAVYRLARQRPAWMGPALQKELAFIGEDNIANRSAVRNLIEMGRARGAKAVWAHHGSASGLERHLPGVRVHVLGPPDLDQTEKIRRMRRSDPDEFWHLLAGPGRLRMTEPLVRGAPRRSATGSSPRVPTDARWFRERLDRMRGDQLLQIVRALDEQMNNTSLILLFEVAGKKLLFPGDAQLENWSYALEDAPDAARTRRLLADVDVYKVGHHGSLNATPKRLLWQNFRKRGAARGRLRALLSTLPGKHGRVQSNTEVPRRPLLEALESETLLLNTHELKFGADPELCHKLVIQL